MAGGPALSETSSILSRRPTEVGDLRTSMRPIGIVMWVDICVDMYVCMCVDMCVGM